MELWELYACAEGHEKQRAQHDVKSIVLAWRTGRFVGLAFNGKLRGLKNYLNEEGTDKKAAPKITKEDFDAKLKKLQGGG